MYLLQIERWYRKPEKDLYRAVKPVVIGDESKSRKR